MENKSPLKLYFVDLSWRGMAMCFARSKEEALNELSEHMEKDKKVYANGRALYGDRVFEFVPKTQEELLAEIKEQEVVEGFSYRNWGDE